MHIANLGFFLNYNTGKTKDEVEAEIFRVVLQNKEEIHYDRAKGGSIAKIENTPQNMRDAIAFIFVADIIQSIYYLNMEKNFDPYIVVGAESIQVDVIDKVELYIEWYLLQDLTISGILEYEV
jgi:hypothetical protein